MHLPLHTFGMLKYWRFNFALRACAEDRMFGEKFYPTLNKLSPWKQSLFALCLAQRQFANYLLWAELTAEGRGISEYNHALKQLWAYHQDKFNHIDLTRVLQTFEPFAPDLDKEEDPSDPKTGSLLALDASLCLTAAFDGIIMHEGDEAEIASKASLAAVVLAVQNQSEELLGEDELRDTALVDEEVNFQVSVLELLIKGQRELELVQLLLKTSLKDGCSNIGIELEDKEVGLCAYNVYALNPKLVKEANAAGKSALKILQHEKQAGKEHDKRSFKEHKGNGKKFVKGGKGKFAPKGDRRPAHSRRGAGSNSADPWANARGHQ